MTDEVHIPEEEREPQDALPEIEAEEPEAASAFEDDEEPIDLPAPDSAEKSAAAFDFTHAEEDEEPIELPTPASIEVRSAATGT